MREWLNRPPIFQAFLLATTFLIFVFNLRSAGGYGPVPRAVLWTVSYPQVVLSRSIDTMGHLWSDYLFLVGLTERYGELAEENTRLRAERARLLELARENTRLKKLLDFKEREAGSLLPARVIGAAYGATSVLTIDRGTRDGVREDMAVVSYEGVVGRTAEVTPLTAQVILLQDPRSRVPVRTLRTRARGIVVGRGADAALVLERVRRTEEIADGDEIVTSGTGFIYPKGIPLGRARHVHRPSYGLHQNAEVEPMVDFGRVEEVLVILKPSADHHFEETEEPTDAASAAPQGSGGES